MSGATKPLPNHRDRRLTARESQYVKLANEGKSREEIASKLKVKPATVANMLQSARIRTKV